MSEKQVVSQDMSRILSDMQNADIDAMISIVKKIDALKVALESVNAFHDKAIAYARLEAEALIRVMDLGGENRLGLTHRRTARWLYGMEEEERIEYISMCSEGLTIDQVYKREVSDVEKQEKKLYAASYYRGKALEDVRKNGIIEMRPLSEQIRKVFGIEHKADAEDVIDGIRKRLRDAGAVGVGDESGTYVMPSVGNRQQIVEAITMRYDSICKDFRNIHEIAYLSGVKITKDELNQSYWHAKQVGESWYPHFLFALANAGVLESDEVFYDTVRKDFAKEVDYVLRQTNLARRDYIKSQFEKEFGRTEA